MVENTATVLQRTECTEDGCKVFWYNQSDKERCDRHQRELEEQREREKEEARKERKHPKGYVDKYTGYHGKQWRDVREDVLERDGYECIDCGISNEEHKRRDDLFPKNGGLHIHHREKSREFESYDEANDDVNLVSLCADCHRKAETGDPDV